MQVLNGYRNENEYILNLKNKISVKAKTLNHHENFYYILPRVTFLFVEFITNKHFWIFISFMNYLKKNILQTI